MSGSILWLQWALYVLVSLLAILFPLLPLGMDGAQPVLPDLFYVITAVWVVRRPESAPFLLVAALALVADFLLTRPPGLWALMTLLGVEFLRGQREVMRDRVYLNEWFTGAAVFAVMLMLNGLILTVALVPTPDTGESWPLWFATTLSLPVAVVVLHYGLYIRWPKPTERLRQFGWLT